MVFSKPIYYDPKYQYIVEALNQRPSAAVLGHSFVRNIDRDFQDEIDYLGLRPAINEGRTSEGKVFSYLLELADYFQELNLRYTPTIRSYETNGPHDVENELLALNILRPHILCIVLSSNDLAHADADPIEIAHDAIALAFRAREEAQVKHVVITSCLNRTRGPVDFYSRMLTFNTEVRRLASISEGISYYRVRGFSETCDGQPLPVHVWSHDGIHPDPDSKYFLKFKLEIRGAIISAISELFATLKSGSTPSPPPIKNIFKHQPPPPPPGAAGLVY